MSRRPLAALATAVLLLGACSGDDDTGATAADSADSSATDGAAAPGAGADESTTTDPAAAAEAATGDALLSTEIPTEEPAGPADDGVTIADSCEGLTEQEISTATGLAFAPGAPSTIADADFQDACDWVTNDGMATAQLIIVDVDVYDQNKASASAVSDTTADIAVPGTDAAYATFDGSIIGMQLGDRFVQMAVIASDGVDRSAAVLELATLVVTRL